jgi:hypothetical protein
VTSSPDDARRLTVATLDELWSNGAPIALPLNGVPACELRLDPAAGEITLVTTYESPEPDVTRLRNITFNPIASDGQELAELTVRVDGNTHGAYSLLATIADGLQINDQPLRAAVAVGCDRHKDLFASRGTLTQEKEIGLFGELLFLDFLIGRVGPAKALAAWQGPFSEEHDFAFVGLTVEIKTTSSERRRHTIHGLTQLVPVRGLPLSLISIQVTRSSPDVGQTLPQLVADVHRRSSSHRSTLDAMLDQFGWESEAADLYGTSWRLRSEPRAYSVDGVFPAMTPDVLASVVPSFGLVSEVMYRVDLSDFAHEPLDDPIGAFVEMRD